MSQLLISGRGSLGSITDRIRVLGIKKVMVFCGKHSFSASGASIALSSSSGIIYFYYSDIAANPTVEGLQRASSVFRDFSPELVLAVGGGSVIDTAKGVLLLCFGSEICGKRPQFWAVPTTAGSGSEATRFAVVYDGEEKKSLENDILLPDTAILDADLLSSCTKEQMIASGSDALCQCIESLWCLFKTTISIRYAEAGLCLIRDGMFDVSNADCFDVDSRMSLLMGAHFSGCAINITRTTAGHALSYGLTKKLGIPHGLAVLAVMQFLVRIMDKKYSFFSNGFSILFKGGDHPKSFPRTFDEYCESVWEAVDIARFFTQEKRASNNMVDELTNSVNIERLMNHPIRLKTDDIKYVYQNIFDRHKESTEI